MIYLLIICLIIIGFLGYKLYQKQVLDKAELEGYKQRQQELQKDIDATLQDVDGIRAKWLDMTIRYNTAKSNTEQEEQKLAAAKNELENAREEYNTLVNKKTMELNTTMEEQRKIRQAELDATFEEKKANLDLELEKTIREYDQTADAAKSIAAQLIEEASKKVEEYKAAEECERQRFESLRKPILLYEMEQQAKRAYTIQLPSEYQEDISYLLTIAADKVRHPDVISKLVWAEYVKPYLDEAFKRLEIKAAPGIYKLTNIDSNKAYIGKSTDVKKRITDHFKGGVGIQAIAHQAVHDAIFETGFWNWTIEVITYCDKDQLSELEKYYIDFFNTQQDGYNRREGG